MQENQSEESNEENNDCDDEKNVYKPAKRDSGQNPKEPQDQKYDGYCY